MVLHINHGRVSTDTETVAGALQLDIPLPSFNPLITGYLDINELVKRPNVTVTGGKHVLRLIDILFPEGLHRRILATRLGMTVTLTYF